MSNNLTTSDQLNSLASAIKAYITTQIATDQDEVMAKLNTVESKIDSLGGCLYVEPGLLDPQVELHIWNEPYTNTSKIYYDISRLGNGVIHYYINGTEATAPYSELGSTGNSTKKLLFLVESDGTYAQGWFLHTKPDTK